VRHFSVENAQAARIDVFSNMGYFLRALRVGLWPVIPFPARYASVAATTRAKHLLFFRRNVKRFPQKYIPFRKIEIMI